MPYDWNNPYDSAIPYDVGNPQFATVTGISTAEVIGHADVSFGTVSKLVTGIPTSESFGHPSVNAPAFLSVTGIPTQEFFSAISVQAPAARSILGIPTAERFGIYATGQFVPIPQLIQSARNFSVSGTTGSISFTTANITYNNTIVVCAAIALPESILGVDDSAGNIYVNRITNINSGVSTVTIWSATVTSGAGTKPIISIRTNGTGLVYAFLWEFSGINVLSPPDTPGVSSGSGSSGVNVNSGHITTNFANDVLVAICLCGTNVTATTLGWTALAGASNAHISSEVLVALAPGVYSANFTQTSASSYNAALVSFRSAILLPAHPSRIL